jgi:hypothetical protein
MAGEPSTLEGYRARAATHRAGVKRLKPSKFEVHGCTLGCSLNPHNLPGEMGKLVHEWYEDAKNDDEIHDLAMRAAQINLSVGAIHRHRRNHMVKVFSADERAMGAGEEEVEAEPMTHVAILELMIQSGARHIPVGRISPELLIKSIDMHHRLTQGSAVDSTLAAIKAAMTGSNMEAPSLIDTDDDAIPVQDASFGGMSAEDNDVQGVTEEEDTAGEG